MNKDIEECWETFWKEIIAPEGTVDLEQVKKELFDYSNLMHNASIVYDNVTGGKISKVNTNPYTVCNVAEEHYEDMYEEYYQELLDKLKELEE